MRNAGSHRAMTKDFRYIVIEGPIGVGKTSLAKKLAIDFDSDLLLEKAEDNPFLASFYKNPRQYALSAQLHFLLQRAQQVQDFRQADLFPRFAHRRFHGRQGSTVLQR